VILHPLNRIVRPSVDHVVRTLKREHDTCKKQVRDTLKAWDARNEDTDYDIEWEAEARHPEGEENQHQQPKQTIE